MSIKAEGWIVSVIKMNRFERGGGAHRDLVVVLGSTAFIGHIIGLLNFRGRVLLNRFPCVLR